jgi:O-antigen ligase
MAINHSNTNKRSEPLAYRVNAYISSHFEIVVIAGTLGFALVLGLGASEFNPIYAILASLVPAALIGFDFFTRNLQLSPIILLVTASVIPFYVSTGTASVVVDSLLLVVMISGLWLLRSIVLERRIVVQKKPYNLPLIAYMVIVVISLIWGTLFRDPTVITWSSFFKVQIAATTVMLMLPVTFLISANLIHDESILRNMSLMMVIIGVLGYLFETRFNYGIIYDFFRITGITVSNQGLFTMWVVIICMAYVLFDRTQKIVPKIAMLVVAAVWVNYRFLWNISWMTGWLPPITALIALIWMRSKKLFVVFLVLIVILALVNISFLQQALANEQTESGLTRLDAWKTNLSLTKDHFLFGTGPGGYAAYYMSYFPDQAMATHNNYLDILAQTGIFGFIFFVSFFAIVLLEGYKLCKQLKGKGDFLEAMANAAFAGSVGCVLAMGLGDWMVPFPYTQGIGAFDYILYSWLFMGTIFAIKKIVNNKLAKANTLSKHSK